METKKQNYFLSFLHTDMTKKNEKKVIIGMILLIKLGIIFELLIAVSNKDIKIGLNIDFILFVTMYILADIWLFLELLYYYNRYNKLKN